MKIIDGRKIKEDLLKEVKKEINKLSFMPVFCDVLIGNDPASLQYVNLKKKIALSLGIDFHEAYFKKNIKTEELIEEIKKINNINNICGLIIQLPLPKNINTKKVLSFIDPSLDVDCLGEYTSNLFYQNKLKIIPPTANACMYLLDSLNIDLKDKNIVVLGYGELVGRPVFALLKQKNLAVISLNSKSKNKKEILKNADVIISGIGKALYIKGDMIKKGVILIDAGTSESTGSIVGDVDFISVQNIAGYVSPVPGGVGPVTIAMLFKNVLEVAKNRNVNNSAIAESLTNHKYKSS